MREQETRPFRVPHSKCCSMGRRPENVLQCRKSAPHSLRNMSLGFLVQLKPYDALEHPLLKMCTG